MKIEQATFYSDGIKLDGRVLLPDDIKSDEKRAAMVLCSGAQGLQQWVPSRWWPQFLEAGYVCMAFDYRGFGTSEGERGQMFPEREAEDVRNAVTYLQQHRNVRADQIGVLGWGLGGGVVIAAAARDENIRAVCCAAGLGSGARTARANMTLADWVQRQDELAEDRTRRALTGKSKAMPSRRRQAEGQAPTRASGAQFDKDIVELGITPVPEMTLETYQAQQDFRPELVADRISPRPLLVVHAKRDLVYSADEAQSVYDHAREPKTLMWIDSPGRTDGHLEWIHPGDPLSKPSIARVVAWFKEKLPPRGATSEVRVPAGVLGR